MKEEYSHSKTTPCHQKHNNSCLQKTNATIKNKYNLMATNVFTCLLRVPYLVERTTTNGDLRQNKRISLERPHVNHEVQKGFNSSWFIQLVQWKKRRKKHATWQTRINLQAHIHCKVKRENWFKFTLIVCWNSSSVA